MFFFFNGNVAYIFFFNYYMSNMQKNKNKYFLMNIQWRHNLFFFYFLIDVLHGFITWVICFVPFHHIQNRDIILIFVFIQTCFWDHDTFIF